MNLTNEQIQERKQVAAIIFSKDGKSVIRGKEQLLQLTAGLVRFDDLEAYDFESILQDVALNLINPDFSAKLSKYSQENAAKVFSLLLYFFRYLESECEDYLNYGALESYCASVPQSVYDNIKAGYTA
ncbi:hypothetical protein LWM68_41240 [Niabella sp. W65]|nr:hypothetical protein [Niabella sp. W65]MCH7368598.1 hypothetical protein [Niabella sp. W65]ULT44186.1 hypothetical protein KRR40_12945 [Niabella sp. I65]